jgi:hypothetical protein
MRACWRVKPNPARAFYVIKPVLGSDHILSLRSGTGAVLLVAANLYLPIRDAHHTMRPSNHIPSPTEFPSILPVVAFYLLLILLLFTIFD